MGGLLVSCIMPTKNGRMAKAAIKSYFLQSHGPKELILIQTFDDKTDFPGLLDEIYREIHNSEANALIKCKVAVDISYVPSGLSIGELRNIAIRRSSGSVIAHWDDDDWSSYNRIEEQLSRLKNGYLITGEKTIYTVNEEKNLSWIYDGKINGAWVAGGTLLYDREIWEASNFDVNIPYGEDTKWVRANSAHLTKHEDETSNVRYISRIHGNNTSPKDTSSLDYVSVPWNQLPLFVGSRFFIDSGIKSPEHKDGVN